MSKLPVSIIPIEFATPEYDQMVQLRDAILRQPLGLEFTAEELAEEYAYFHLVAYDARLQMVGCMVLVPRSEEVVQMRQVAVRADLQGQGIGRQLVEASEVFAQSKGFQRMMLHAREVALPFYKALAYDTFGEPFEEVSVPHYKMEKHLT